MAARVDLFDNTYANFAEQVLADVRRETFGEDIGQNSWLTADEFDRFIDRLHLTPDHHGLEIASGSGGPAVYLAQSRGCRVTGIDVNRSGIAAAMRRAEATRLGERVHFQFADADASLPFESDRFDAVLCIDSMNHFPDRLAVLTEWHRVLRAGSRAVFTDPVVVTGAVTHAELAARSSVGPFLFAPPGVNEQLIARAGLRLVDQQDVTANAALVSGRWHAARQRYHEELRRLEGDERFAGLQQFFSAVNLLTRERRLSRIAYWVEKPAS